MEEVEAGIRRETGEHVVSVSICARAAWGGAGGCTRAAGTDDQMTKVVEGRAGRRRWSRTETEDQTGNAVVEDRGPRPRGRGSSSSQRRRRGSGSTTMLCMRTSSWAYFAATTTHSLPYKRSKQKPSVLSLVLRFGAYRQQANQLVSWRLLMGGGPNAR